MGSPISFFIAPIEPSDSQRKKRGKPKLAPKGSVKEEVCCSQTQSPIKSDICFVALQKRPYVDGAVPVVHKRVDAVFIISV